MAPPHIRAVPDSAIPTAWSGSGSRLKYGYGSDFGLSGLFSAAVGDALPGAYVQGVRHVAPPERPPLPPWDLNSALSVLQRAPIEDILEIPLLTLSQKVVFLAAITSVRRV